MLIHDRILTLLGCFAMTCLLLSGRGPDGTAGDDRPAGDDPAKFETVADRLGGFEQTMMEVGEPNQVQPLARGHGVPERDHSRGPCAYAEVI